MGWGRGSVVGGGRMESSVRESWRIGSLIAGGLLTGE